MFFAGFIPNALPEMSSVPAAVTAVSSSPGHWKPLRKKAKVSCCTFARKEEDVAC